jgi:hypothetical protein
MKNSETLETNFQMNNQLIWKPDFIADGKPLVESELSVTIPSA